MGRDADVVDLAIVVEYGANCAAQKVGWRLGAAIMKLS
jgi:hypothetical protein